ncbi:MAG TPA: ABC transporter ATP-binding protein [Ilumatobacter sp.]|nr:ABC transporter ATP-binding protein [Ilumatobacter sp.]
MSGTDGPDQQRPAEDGNIHQSAAAIQARRSNVGPARAVGMPVERTDNFWPTVRRLGRLLGRETRLLWLVAAFTVVSVTLISVGPRILGQATDIIVTGASVGDVDGAAVARKLVLAGVLFAIGTLLQWGQAYMVTGIVQRSMQHLRDEVEVKLHRLPLTYVDVHARGDLLSRVTNDIDNLAQSLQQTCSQILQNVCLLVAVAAMMLIVSPVLALVALIGVPLVLWTLRVVGSRARPKFISQWHHTGSVNSRTEEVFTGHAIVKVFGRQHEAEQQFAADNEQLFEASFHAQFRSNLVQPLMMLIGNLQFVAVAVVGGLRISSGSATLGEVQAMIQYTRNFAQPLTMVATMFATFQSGVASAERVLELLDADEVSPEAAPVFGMPGQLAATEVRGRVAFEHVDFGYSPGRPLITDLDVVAEPGQTIAIVGPTGAGKTTIVNLLMRFYELDGGRITLDGVDITTLPRAELRARVGMVLQDTWLFGGTIRENLRYGNPNATDEQVVEAAKVAYVDRFVRHLPDGYDTVINDEGDNVSAGEKQLMTIARAFLADPSILILDEATSSVDTRTEVLIQEAMNRLRANRTSFVIAHRLSTIRGADIILVMEQGRIVERGNHDELLEQGGAYAALYNAQFAGLTT